MNIQQLEDYLRGKAPGKPWPSGGECAICGWEIEDGRLAVKYNDTMNAHARCYVEYTGGLILYGEWVYVEE